MATINVDFSQFGNDMMEVMRLLSNNEITLRPVAVELVDMMHERIHNRGQASDGSQIGTYSPGYLAERARHKHSTSETNVILVLTRKLSNSWGAFATDRGYAVGFVDESAVGGVSSLDKIKFAEEGYGKKIGDLSEQEAEYAGVRIVEIVNDVLSDYGRG